MLCNVTARVHRPDRSGQQRTCGRRELPARPRSGAQRCRHCKWSLSRVPLLRTVVILWQCGRTAATHAAENGHLQVFEELLAAGATAPGGFDDATAKLGVALRGAARDGNLVAVHTLMEQ